MSSDDYGKRQPPTFTTMPGGMPGRFVGPREPDEPPPDLLVKQRAISGMSPIAKARPTNILTSLRSTAARSSREPIILGRALVIAGSCSFATTMLRSSNSRPSRPVSKISPRIAALGRSVSLSPLGPVRGRLFLSQPEQDQAARDPRSNNNKEVAA
jgi:hypothetical protein